jgi:hypothetical protein
LPATGTPTVDHGTSGFGFHSGPEPMGPVTLQIAGLKGSLAHDASLPDYF